MQLPGMLMCTMIGFCAALHVLTVASCCQGYCHLAFVSDLPCDRMLVDKMLDMTKPDLYVLTEAVLLLIACEVPCVLVAEQPAYIPGRVAAR